LLDNDICSKERTFKWFDYYTSGFLQPLEGFLDTVKYAADGLDIRPVKLAVLTTGVNKHMLREFHSCDLKDKVRVRSFVHNDLEGYDNIGIGTKVTRLLLILAPSAEIHVLKITSGSFIEAPQVEKIVKVSHPMLYKPRPTAELTWAWLGLGY
jgi:hypothetical protein